MASQVRAAAVFVLVVLFPCLAVSATIYLKDSRAIPADEFTVKGNMLEYKVAGIPNQIPMDQIKSIDPGGNPPPAQTRVSPQRQPQQPPPAPPKNTQPNPIAAIPEAKARQDLKENLAARYPNSYSTQKMLLDAGMRDYKNLCQMPSHPVSDGIMRDLSSRYYPSFGTIWMLYKKNVQDYVELQKK